MSDGSITDLQVYKQLAATADALENLSPHALSLVGETALKTAAQAVRGMANAVYEHSLAAEDDAAA